MISPAITADSLDLEPSEAVLSDAALDALAGLMVDSILSEEITQ